MALENCKYFALTTLDKGVMFIKTTKHKTALDLIKDCERNNIVLQVIDKENNNQPTAFCTGYFVSAKEINESLADQRYNRIWELL